MHFDKIGFRKMRQHVEIFVGGQLSLFDVTREAMVCAWFQHTSCNCVSTYKLPFTSMYTRHTSMDIGPILVALVQACMVVGMVVCTVYSNHPII